MPEIRDFCERLGSTSPAPGGGAAAGITLSLAAACAEKAARFSFNDDKNEFIKRFSEIRDIGLRLSEEDQSAFSGWQEAKRLPKETDEEKQTRNEKINYFTAECAKVPFNICKNSLKIVFELENFISYCNKWLISDAAMGAVLAKASFDSGLFNININLPYLKNQELLTEIDTFIKDEKELFYKSTDYLIAFCNNSLKK